MPVPDLTTYNWNEILGAGHPGVTERMGMVWVGDGILLYGGQSIAFPFGNGTWKYSVPGDTWSQLFPAADPGSRYGFSMAFNPDDGYALLFGGYDPLAATWRADTWKYDLGTANWTNLAPAHSPTINGDYSALSTVMGYIGSGFFVLYSQSTPGATGVSALSLFDGADWTDITPASDPAAGQGFNLLSAPASCVRGGKFTIFGGSTNSQPAKDVSTLYATHEYTVGDWAVPANAVHPNPFPSSVVLSHPDHTREALRFGMASDGTQGLLFGGRLYDLGIFGTFSVADTWRLGNTGWTDLGKTGPLHRYDQAMVWDDINLRFLMYGGYAENAAIGVHYTDTWEFAGPPPPPDGPYVKARYARIGAPS